MVKLSCPASSFFLFFFALLLLLDDSSFPFLGLVNINLIVCSGSEKSSTPDRFEMNIPGIRARVESSVKQSCLFKTSLTVFLSRAP